MNTTDRHLVTLLPGDGIGAEVSGAARRIIDATAAAIDWEECEAGAEVFKKGLPSGVPKETIDSIDRTRVVFKGPLETPVGFGEKSANVTLRKLFETYANVRPVRELPGVTTPYSGRGIDLVIVRENVEDLYAGIEYRQTPGAAECLKVISSKGCERISRFAFELARAEGRNEVVCATKANIMKMTEGLLKKTFESLAPDYPDIESWHIIVDNCAHQLVKKPEQFDVITTTNMNGDILSDLTSGLIGGLGFAPSANIGNDVAIFEAVHGSAPKYTGKNVINPTAIILSSVMMLRHLGEFDAASQIENALLVTYEDGEYLTRDVVGDEKACSTTEFTDAIIANLGRKSDNMQAREYKKINLPQVSAEPVQAASRSVVGVDVFVETPLSVEELATSAERLVESSPVKLKLISSRGTVVYPATGANTLGGDFLRCRFEARDQDADLSDEQVIDLVQRVAGEHKWMHIEKLQLFDGEPAWTKAQGED